MGAGANHETVKGSWRKLGGRESKRGVEIVGGWCEAILAPMVICQCRVDDTGKVLNKSLSSGITVHIHGNDSILKMFLRQE